MPSTDRKKRMVEYVAEGYENRALPALEMAQRASGIVKKKSHSDNVKEPSSTKSAARRKRGASVGND